MQEKPGLQHRCRVFQAQWPCEYYSAWPFLPSILQALLTLFHGRKYLFTQGWLDYFDVFFMFFSFECPLMTYFLLLKIGTSGRCTPKTFPFSQNLMDTLHQWGALVPGANKSKGIQWKWALSMWQECDSGLKYEYEYKYIYTYVLNSFTWKTSSSPKKILSPNFRELHVFLSRYRLAKIFEKNVDVWYPEIVPGVWSLVTLHSAAAALKHLRSALRCWSLLTFIGQFWHSKSTV